MGEEDKEFTVRDRRGAGQDASQEPSARKPDTAETAPDSASGEPRQAPGALEEIDFSTFILSLATSAQINLGNVPNPETNRTSQNIPAAKQMIDILGMLQEKTKGNLSKEEAALLEQVLFNLRMHFVRVAEGQKKSGVS